MVKSDMTIDEKVFNPIGMSLPDIEAHLLSNGIKMAKMRAAQIYDWVYNKRINDIHLASNLSNEIKTMVSLHLPETVRHLTSSDGTQKLLLRLDDGEKIESVFIPSEYGGTVCVSSQVGCKMGCKFCNTAQQGFSRDLTCGEILSQVMIMQSLGYNVTNIVFMGMGEPLNNFANLEKALTILTDEKAFRISKQKITISTSGVIPGIKQLEKLKYPLAISLHAVTDEKRSRIMPVNYQFPIAELLKSVRDYRRNSKVKKITFEYMMIKDFNDTPEDASLLVKLLKGHNFKVNLIPFNNWGHKFFIPSDNSTILKFQAHLKSSGIQCNIRKSMGHDIMAACGELKASSSY